LVAYPGLKLDGLADANHGGNEWHAAIRVPCIVAAPETGQVEEIQDCLAGDDAKQLRIERKVPHKLSRLGGLARDLVAVLAPLRDAPGHPLHPAHPHAQLWRRSSASALLGHLQLEGVVFPDGSFQRLALNDKLSPAHRCRAILRGAVCRKRPQQDRKPAVRVQQLADLRRGLFARQHLRIHAESSKHLSGQVLQQEGVAAQEVRVQRSDCGRRVLAEALTGPFEVCPNGAPQRLRRQGRGSGERAVDVAQELRSPGPLLESQQLAVDASEDRQAAVQTGEGAEGGVDRWRADSRRNRNRLCRDGLLQRLSLVLRSDAGQRASHTVKIERHHRGGTAGRHSGCFYSHGVSHAAQQTRPILLCRAPPEEQFVDAWLAPEPPVVKPFCAPPRSDEASEMPDQGFHEPAPVPLCVARPGPQRSHGVAAPADCSPLQDVRSQTRAECALRALRRASPQSSQRPCHFR